MKGTLHVKKSFPDHKGIPGHQGGSLPKSGGATSSGSVGAGKGSSIDTFHAGTGASKKFSEVHADIASRASKYGYTISMSEPQHSDRSFPDHQGKPTSYQMVTSEGDIFDEKHNKVGRLELLYEKTGRVMIDVFHAGKDYIPGMRAVIRMANTSLKKAGFKPDIYEGRGNPHSMRANDKSR